MTKVTNSGDDLVYTGQIQMLGLDHKTEVTLSLVDEKLTTANGYTYTGECFLELK